MSQSLADNLRALSDKASCRSCGNSKDGKPCYSPKSKDHSCEVRVGLWRGVLEAARASLLHAAALNDRHWHLEPPTPPGAVSGHAAALSEELRKQAQELPEA